MTVAALDRSRADASTGKLASALARFQAGSPAVTNDDARDSS